MFNKNILIVFASLVVFFLASCTKVDNTYTKAIVTAGKFRGNTYEYLKTQPAGVYDSLIKAIDRIPDLRDILRTKPVTLFAANNASFSLAFNTINRARKDSIPTMPEINISTIDSVVLDSFLCRYIINDKVYSKDLMASNDGILVRAMRYDNYKYDMHMQLTYTDASGYLGGGPRAIVFSDPNRSIFSRYWFRVNTITIDIETSNGLVHALPPGHAFGFGDRFVIAANKR